MDINVLRSVVTLCAFVLFVAIVVWAYRPSGRGQFDEAARLPFHEEE
jgi:cytochrome c oxidase cbb3-type subunit 4